MYIAGGRKSGEIFLPPPSFLPPSMQGGGGEGTACKQQQQRGTRVFADVASLPLPTSILASSATRDKDSPKGSRLISPLLSLSEVLNFARLVLLYRMQKR